MKSAKHIILTPIAGHKLYSLDRFLKNIITFKLLPKEIVFCAEPDNVSEILKWQKKLKEKGIKLVILELEQEILSKYPPTELGRIMESREKLRHYFIKSSFEWALWLDSDIIPDNDIAQVLLKIAQTEKFLAVTNEYPGRGDYPWAGIACTLTHKAACTVTKFDIGYIYWEGKEKHLSEDFYFLSILDAGNGFIKMWTGWSGRKIGKFVSVFHEIYPGVDKFLKKSL